MDFFVGDKVKVKKKCFDLISERDRWKISGELTVLGFDNFGYVRVDENTYMYNSNALELVSKRVSVKNVSEKEIENILLSTS